MSVNLQTDANLRVDVCVFTKGSVVNEGCGPSLKEDVCFCSGKCVFQVALLKL